MERYGDKNEGIKFGILEISNTSFDGFGAFVKFVLGALMIMDEQELLPFIDIKSVCYTERKKVNGTFNAFEYYFEQPCDVILNRHVPREEILQSRHVTFISQDDAAKVLAEKKGERGYYWQYDDQDTLKKAAAALRKYIRLNAFTAHVYDEVREMLGDGNDVIGVHLRHSGFKVPIPGHAIAVEPAEGLELVKKIQKNRKIFLATDDEEVIEVFSNDEEYKKGNIAWYEDVMRSSKKTAYNMSAYMLEDDRELHKYRLGYEILKEILTLSCCNSLVAGRSNVNLTASILKLSRGEWFDEYYIIDKGTGGEENSNFWEYQLNRAKVINWEYRTEKERSEHAEHTVDEK